jgi:O-antigen/teichoic acid export membrane protein
MIGRARNLLSRLSSSLWSGLEFGSAAVASFVFTPLLFRQLGQEQFGAYALLVALATFGYVVGLGVPTATSRFVAEQAAVADDRAGLRRAVSECGGLAIWSVIVGVVVVLAAGAVIHAFGAALAGIADQLPWPVLAAAALYAAMQFDAYASACMKGLEQFRPLALTEAAGRVSMYAALLAVAIAVPSPGWLIAAQALAYLVFGIVKCVIFKRGAGLTSMAPAMAPAGILRIFAFARWPWVQSIGGALFNSGDRLAIGSVLGPSAVAVYAIALQLGQLVQNLTIAVFQPLLPKISRLFAERAFPEIIRLGGRTNRLNLLTASIAALASAALTIPFLQLWMGREFAAANGTVVLLIVLSFCAMSTSAASYFILVGAGKVRTVAMISLGAGVAMLASLGPMLWLLNIHGAAASRGIYAAVALLQLVALVRLFRELKAPAPDAPTAAAG